MRFFQVSGSILMQCQPCPAARRRTVARGAVGSAGRELPSAVSTAGFRTDQVLTNESERNADEGKSM
jgi:hypothetical protein